MTNHDHKGRFAQGNKASPGRPRRATEGEYVVKITELCPPDVWETIVKRAVFDAEGGDHVAREWLGKFLIGSPPKMLDLPLSDIEDLAFIIRALKERGGDVSDALRQIVSMTNAGIALAQEAAGHD